ncbi:DNA cytosine methyltransferase [Flavobacterium lipolyticum]|uniref:DNA (cytosine-5-)-methyltransferase n=1 Tax=Flavobacterium lipolyticum TaxID=2893754 RepID=A0ABS8LZS1_9FLAO|nr:DNA cytosine methyltransferase [Flavobacterium sp. F-126]MCC9018089.1 DNA cytosine methyltransferase [Flavobacterium sp. F-126]
MLNYIYISKINYNITLTHIELFAGCGGMSLGLDSAGFELFFANELSPMAGETFAYNILNENLQSLSQKKESAIKSLWIKSNYPKNDLENRLRENPFSTSNGNFSDLQEDINLKEKLLIGNIDHLLDFLNENPAIIQELKEENIDLISGGPPCQSFSLAGRREKDNHKNQLPLSFAKFAGLVQPKTVLLENVKGITSPFTEGEDENKQKYYAWLEVSKAFVLEGFVPICMMLNSKYFGVPQNRPRFILQAYRKDIFDNLKQLHLNNEILLISERFYNLVIANNNNLEKISIKDFKYYDIENNPELFNGIILPKISHLNDDFITTYDAIEDIKNASIKYELNKTNGQYPNLINSIFSFDLDNSTQIRNHEERNHNFLVKSRFRFYQVVDQFQNGLKKDAIDLFTGKTISKNQLDKLNVEFSKHKLLFIENNIEVYKAPKDIETIEALIKSIPTRKHSQRALRKFEPAPAQLTIPDDLCHYDPDEPRTLTVREMARFQSFPDWYEFRSKVTTGGKMRKFEVPQYTQVGNAVPPLLALALGELIKIQIQSLQ